MNERKSMSSLRKDFLLNEIPSFILYDGDDFASRPFDMIIMWDKKFVAIEGKFQKSFGAFGMKQIRDSQIVNLNMISNSGGMAYIFLIIWISNKEHRLLIWEWNEFKRITKEGSIKKKELEAMGYIQVKSKQYQVDKICEKFACFRNYEDL